MNANFLSAASELAGKMEKARPSARSGNRWTVVGLCTWLVWTGTGWCQPVKSDRAGERKVNQANANRRADSPPRILVHYMPWFVARPQSPVWGWHWTMGTFDPDGTKTGHPTIASHYHPLIGPYDSSDPDVIEYHILLMKLAGIDGVVIDWYGTVDHLDYAVNHRNTSAFVDHAARAGLQFAICYEDQTIPRLVAAGRIKNDDRVKHAQREIAWLADHWFQRASYLKQGRIPVLLSFGSSGLSDQEWENVLAASQGKLTYLSEHHRRKGADGAFDWPSPRAGIRAHRDFETSSRGWPVAMTVAFPRFHDIYEQAHVHESWGNIGDDQGKTFASTLERALRAGVALVQICTWNDWGEGTVIEPSDEFQYRDLEVVQRLRRQIVEPAFAAGPDQLRLPMRLYRLRKRSKNEPRLTPDLEKVSKRLIERDWASAAETLELIEKRGRSDP
jgi:hypothetical protein